MWKYVLKRLLLLIPVMLGTILVVFFIMDQSDVDPAKVMLGDAATEETIAQLHEELWLDDPFLVRYARYVLNLIKGDMGTSYNYHTPVANQIAARLPNTILLAGTAVLLTIIYVIESIKTQDIPSVLGCVVTLSVMFTIVNVLVDILYAFVDPRIKAQYKRAGRK